MSDTRVVNRAWISRPVVNRNGIFFWLLGYAIRVRYTFFLIALMSGAARRNAGQLLVWILVVFAAILLHELGHAMAARGYGANPVIEIHGFGGLTSWSWPGTPTWTARVATSLAGPGIGFFFGGALYGLIKVVGLSRENPLARLAVGDFLWVTLAWGIFNLLPILPLDGGGALDAILGRLLGAERGRYWTRIVSCAAAGAAAFLALRTGMPWAGVFCAAFAYDNFQQLRGLPGVRLAG
jgi:Zn-dependent protease